MWDEALRVAKLAVVLSVGCLLVQHSSDIFSYFIRESVSFEKVDGTDSRWVGSIEHLPIGIYYLSMGRPRGVCHVALDGRQVASNGSPVREVIGDLILGVGFSQGTPNFHQEIQIDCESLGGFNVKLTHTPIVSYYLTGKILEWMRAVTELLLGPICSIILLGFAVIRFLSSSNSWSLQTPARKSDFLFIVFSGVAVLYSLSLAYYTRQLMAGSLATFLHIFLRLLFSVGSVLYFSSYNKQNKYILWLCVFLLSSTVFVHVFEESALPSYYSVLYALFPILTGYCTYSLFQNTERTVGMYLLRSLAAAWTLVQCSDLVKRWYDFGAFAAPSVLAMITCVIVYAKIREDRFRTQVESATRRILSAIEANSSLRDILTQIATTTSVNTHFRRVSAYLDAFVVGLADSPHCLYIRVMESGYSKDTRKDEKVLFSEGRGKFMQRAMESGDLSVGNGPRDKAPFMIVPIGKHACINLSDDRPSSVYSVFESETVLRNLHPALRTLNSKIMAQGFRQGIALERIRVAKGDGTFECLFGAVFADIADFSAKMERYGQSFAEFVNGVFLVAMAKAVAHVAVPEWLRGDEAYFITIGELLPEGMSVSEGTLEIVGCLRNFVQNEGAQLCEAYGFEPLEISIGASSGSGSLVCDRIKVRTAGVFVNQAKRFQQAAPSGDAIIELESLAEETRAIVYGEPVPVLRKKNFRIGFRVKWRELEGLRQSVEWRAKVSLAA